MKTTLIPINDSHQTAHEFFALIDNNRAYLSQWLTWLEHTKSPADSQSFLTHSLGNVHEGKELDYFIKVDGKLAGIVGVRDIGAGLIKEDTSKVAGIVGYWLAEAYTGKGVTTDALKQLIHIIRDDNDNKAHNHSATIHRLDTLILRAHPDNIGSNKVAKKCGFTFEYIAPKAEKLHGEWCDLNVYYLNI